MKIGNKFITKSIIKLTGICKYGVFASVKEILEMDGFAFHGVRKPFTSMTEEGRKELRRVYEEIIIPNR